MHPFPTLDAPESQCAERDVEIRYEDIAQDGRVKLGVLPHAMGLVCFRHLLANRAENAAMRAQGIVPILTRLVIEGFGGPIHVRYPLRTRGAYEIAHTKDPQTGEVDRVLLALRADMEGVKGSMHGPPMPTKEHVPAGRCYAEHVFTRLFAPKEQRKVLRLDSIGLPHPPGAEREFIPGSALLKMPEDATPLDPSPEADTTSILLGLVHTDANQHVNSLEYPRLFEDAVLRRLAKHERPTNLLSRALDVRYRKPCFAGDRVRFVLSTYTRGDEVIATGILVPDSDHSAAPHCFIRMRLAP